jgi:stage IV sporulation protein FB
MRYRGSMLRDGYLHLVRWGGASIKVHWSVPVASVVFGGFRWRPGFLLGFTLLILLHELGHAAVVRALDHRVVAVEVTGLGGTCHWSGNASPFEESLIAWGGVLAQLLGWVAAELWLGLSGGVESSFGAELVLAFTATNLRLALVNLIPVEPLDGARAWQIFAAWRSRGPRDLPYGTWRDHSSNVQRRWYDRVRRSSEARRREEPPPSHAAPVSEDGPLSPEGRRAIDDLLRHTLGEVAARREGDDD